MNKKTILFASLLLGGLPLMGTLSAEAAVRDTISINQGWQFHRGDVKNIAELKSTQSGDDDVAEGSDSRNRFSTGLQISTRNRIGVLSDAMLVFATGKINVRDMSARDLEGGYGVINVLVDVTSVHQLNNIISRLRSVKGVVDVTRTVDTN